MSIEQLERERGIPQKVDRAALEARRDEIRLKEAKTALIAGPVALLLVGGAGYLAYSAYERMFGPDPQVEAAKEAAEQRREAAQLAFEVQQGPLWARQASTLTMGELGAEIRKCKAAAEAQNPSPYQWIWGNWDGKKALKDIRTGFLSEVTLAGAVRVEMLNKVMLADYRCSFRGAGFETVQKVDPRFSDHYPQEE